MNKHNEWFAELLEAELTCDIATAEEILSHITPEVIAEYLPNDLVAKIVESSLETGEMSPKAVLSLATPVALAENIPHAILWNCIEKNATATLFSPKASITKGQRKFLLRAIATGSGCGIVSSADILVFATPEVLAAELPAKEKGKLLAAGLGNKKMGPDFMVDTIGIATLVEHLRIQVLWAIVNAAGARLAGSTSKKPRAKLSKKPPKSPAARLATIADDGDWEQPTEISLKAD